MKRYIACVIAAAAVMSAFSAFTGCGKNKSSNSESLKGADFQTEVGTLQPDPLAPSDSETDTKSSVEDTSDEVKASDSEHNGNKESGENGTEPIESDPLGGGAFTCNEDGAVVFKDYKDADDRTLMAAAERLFDSACNTEWDFKFDMPFEVDSTQYIENEFGWRYSLITTPGINSLADVENEYNKVFSSKYPNTLSENFCEQNGRVYGFTGGRGSNIFYSASKVTSVDSVGEDEILFTVTSYFDGSDINGSAPYQVEDEFSAVIDENGVWHAGKFTLPY